MALIEATRRSLNMMTVYDTGEVSEDETDECVRATNPAMIESMKECPQKGPIDGSPVSVDMDIAPVMQSGNA